MAGNDQFLRPCPICLEVPTIPKILPCQHVYCMRCLDKIVRFRAEPEAGGGDHTPHAPRACSMCRQPFSVLPKPAEACQPYGDVNQEFEADKYKSSGELDDQWIVATDVAPQKVMGMTLLDNQLFVVYHKKSTVYVYDVTGTPPRDVRAAVRVFDTDLKWPRGIAANVRTKVLYAIDWTRMFSGWLSKMSTDAVVSAQFARLEHQPFGVSVTPDDLVVVVVATPLRRAMPLGPKHNKIFIYNDEGFLQHTIHLPDSLQIPRHAIQVGFSREYLVCHGWLRPGQIVRVDSEGNLVRGSYGCQASVNDQALSKPLSLCDDGSGSVLVVDYGNSRVHLLNEHLQFVKHVVTQTDNGVAYPRHVCVDAGRGALFVGSENGCVVAFSILR